MGEVFKDLPDLIRASRITSSFMENVALATTLIKVPGTIEIPRIVAAAARMGGALDDCFDRTNRKAAQEAVLKGERSVKPLTTPELWKDYTSSWKILIAQINSYRLDSNQARRVIQNSVIFFRNIRAIEMSALSQTYDSWTLQQAIDYRKSVCLIWAEYFASLSPRASLLIDLTVGNTPSQILNEHVKIIKTHKPVGDLYFGSVAYQMVGDWANRLQHQASFIPGLGSLGCEAITDTNAKKVIEEQIKHATENKAMGWMEVLSCKYGLPLMFKLIRAQVPDSDLGTK